MAKDPAMLWYWGDWNSGTGLLSRFLKGCYMDLLHAQFNNGHLSLEEIKTCLGSDFGTSWPTLQKKFIKDDNGLYFNARLEEEKIKRQKFTESRRQNRLEKVIKPSCDASYDKHMNDHMENENENKNLLKKESKNFPSMPLPENCGECTEQMVKDCLTIYQTVNYKKIQGWQVTALWPIFLRQYATGKNYYASIQSVRTHFTNWIKTQKFKVEEQPETDKLLAFQKERERKEKEAQQKYLTS